MRKRRKDGRKVERSRMNDGRRFERKRKSDERKVERRRMSDGRRFERKRKIPDRPFFRPYNNPYIPAPHLKQISEIEDIHSFSHLHCTHSSLVAAYTHDDF
jgi:hypothetical protein